MFLPLKKQESEHHRERIGGVHAWLWAPPLESDTEGQARLVGQVSVVATKVEASEPPRDCDTLRMETRQGKVLRGHGGSG